MELTQSAGLVHGRYADSLRNERRRHAMRDGGALLSRQLGQSRSVSDATTPRGSRTLNIATDITLARNVECNYDKDGRRLWSGRFYWKPSGETP